MPKVEMTPEDRDEMMTMIGRSVAGVMKKVLPDDSFCLIVWPTGHAEDEGRRCYRFADDQEDAGLAVALRALADRLESGGG